MLDWLRRPSFQIALAGPAMALVIIGIFAYSQWASYESAKHRAERDLRSAAGLLAEHMARTLEGVEETLVAVARVREDVMSGRVPRDPAMIHRFFRAIHGSSPVFRGIGWIDENGQQVASSASPVPLGINIATQEHFRVHVDGMKGGSLYVAAPMHSVRDGAWIINVTAPLRDADGGFAGVVGAALDVEYFHRVYRDIELRSSGVVTLFRNDGVILARDPGGNELLGTAPARRPYPAEATLGVPKGTFGARGLSDSAERIVGYAPVPGPDFVVTVALTRADALAEFHHNLRSDGIRTGLWLLMLLAGTVMLMGQLRRRERLQAELQTASMAAAAASAAKSDFLSRMSHELRTPLNAVIGFGQLLQINREQTLTKVQREYADHIVGGGQHLLSLVNEVLDLSGVETGKLKLSIERVGVFDMLTQIHMTMKPVAAKSGITMLDIDMAPVPDIRADAQRLRQVMLNLVSNAVKYNREGGSVALSAVQVSDDRVRIVVTDTGIGISPGHQKDLFQPFHRLGAEYTAIEGMGIGLALAKRLVEAMGGNIGFTTEVGRGSSFWIEFPIEKADNVLPDGKALLVSGAAPARGYTMLYVEDNPANLRLVEHLVATFPDVTLLTAPRPQLGLDLARAHRPNVIILDINLPEMNGFEVLARLKAMPETLDIPVVALSAAAMPKDIKRGLAAGFFSYLTKPLDVTEFQSKVEVALKSNQSIPPVAKGA